MREYRLWITVPDLPVDDEERWEPIIAHLEEHYGLGRRHGVDRRFA
jgi:hypothetical protein